MKKLIYILLLFLAFSNTSYALEDEGTADLGLGMEDLDGQRFFRSPMSNKMMDPDTFGGNFGYDDYNFEDNGRTYKELKEGDMPMFKQFRVILTNKIRKMSPEDKNTYDENGNIVEPEDTGEEVNTSNKESVSKSKKWQFWKRRKNTKSVTIQNDVLEENSLIANSIKDEVSSAEENNIGNKVLSFETGISKNVTEKELMLDADSVVYDEDTGDMVATGGRPLLYLPAQNTKIVADKMTYNQDSNILKGFGDVLITKDGLPTHADYVEVDMNEEALLMDNVESRTNNAVLDANKAVHKNDLLVLTDGNLHSDISEIYRLSSRMIGPAFSSLIVDDDDRALFWSNPEGNKVNLNIREIYIDAGKNFDKFTAKHIEFQRKGKHWFTWPSLTGYTDKDREYFEASYPEFGTKRKLGMFIGPGFAFGGPFGSIMKVIPFINYQHDKIGFGGALKYRNKFNYTELGYGSVSNIFFLKGIQRLDDNFFLQYSANTFMDEWFLGQRMPKYMAELYFDKQYKKRDFLAKNKGLTFRHRAGFGLMEDNDRNYYGERINSNGTTTTRLRYMAQINQNIYSYSKPEDRFYFNVSFVMQGSAALYGTGDMQFIGRMGPSAHIQYKNWMQNMAYYQAAYDDNTPVPRYDKYRYGHSSFYLSEVFRINKYLSVGWSGMVNLSNDSPNGKLFQENRFAIAVGPDDIKIRLGYDFVRRSTYFGFDLAFDTKGTTINYGKMEIKNPERLGRKEKNESGSITFTPVKPLANEVKVSNKKSNSKSGNSVLEYARVINIEDPDKETID